MDFNNIKVDVSKGPNAIKIKSAIELLAKPKHIFNFLQEKFDAGEDFGYLCLNKTQPQVVGRMIPGGGSEYSMEHSFTLHSFENSQPTGIVTFSIGGIDTSQARNPRCVMARLGAWVMLDHLSK